MKKIHKKRLARLAIALLDHWDAKKGILSVGKRQLRFDMTDYIHDSEDDGQDPNTYECGTSCCFLGFSPFVSPATRRMETWDEVHKYMTGHEDGDPVGHFLFGGQWPDDPVQAAKRALVTLQDEVPSIFGSWVTRDFDTLYLKSMSRTKLRAALQEYAN